MKAIASLEFAFRCRTVAQLMHSLDRQQERESNEVSIGVMARQGRRVRRCRPAVDFEGSVPETSDAWGSSDPDELAGSQRRQ